MVVPHDTKSNLGIKYFSLFISLVFSSPLLAVTIQVNCVLLNKLLTCLWVEILLELIVSEYCTIKCYINYLDWISSYSKFSVIMACMDLA